jgi:hypothetical protein
VVVERQVIHFAQQRGEHWWVRVDEQETEGEDYGREMRGRRRGARNIKNI